MLLDCFYRHLGPVNRRVADQISLGGLTRLPYAMAAQLLDHIAKTKKETEKDQILATLLTQLDLVAKQIMELEFGELSRARRATKPFVESPLLTFNFLVFKAFDSATFGEKPEFAECTWRLAEDTARPKVVGRDMLPCKRNKGIKINEDATASATKVLMSSRFGLI
uniref:Uncharacterized protein n=1 Tax=Solanum tuberosum TaxID=4113 RepID=M1DDE6_SOLTU